MDGVGFIVFIILVIIAVAGIRSYMSASPTQQTGQPGTQNSGANAVSHGSQTVRPNSSLPPIRSGTPQRPAVRAVQQPRLPSYQASVKSIYEFPHCPKCWSKNRQGEAQAVFWLADAGCYRCARGHRFRRNGTLIG